MMAGGRSSRMDDSASWLQAKKKNMDFNGMSIFNPSNRFHPKHLHLFPMVFPMAKMGPLLAAQLCHQHVPPCKLLTIRDSTGFESPRIAKKNHSKMVKRRHAGTCLSRGEWNECFSMKHMFSTIETPHPIILLRAPGN